MSYVLVVDAGTQSMRGLIFDEKGTICAHKQVKYPPYISRQNGYIEQSVYMYWDTLCQITNMLKDEHADLLSKVVAMSVTTFRDTAVLLDENYNVLRDCILWSDQRIADTSQKLPLLQRVLFRLVGMTRPVNAIRQRIKTRWIEQNEPELWTKVKKLVHVSTFLNYKLTGNMTDSYASATGHFPFDYKKKKWHTKRALLYPVYNLSLDKMVPLCNPGDVMGTITKEAAECCGLPEGLRVIASGADKSCETLGGGCLDRDVAAISFGTASTVQFSTKKYFEPEPFMPAYPSVLKEYFNPEVQIFRGYWMITWFKQNFAKELEEIANRQGTCVEALLDDEARAIPAGCDGLVLQPFWQAGLTSPEARGAIVGFSDFHTRAHVYRAILEGIDFALREGMERMERRGKQRIKYVTVAGGGAQSDLVCQIAADILNKPVRRIQTNESSGLGAAIVTFVACGVHSDVHTAVEQMVHYKETFTPNADNVKVYDDIYKNVYLKLYSKLKRFYRHIEKTK